MLGTNLFMAACMWLFLPIVYVTMRNNTVCKNNLILSVTLPPEARQDREVLDYCAAFRKRLLRTVLILTAALVPAVFLPWTSVSCTWSMIWLLAAMAVIMWTYGRGFEGLKAIKQRRGWQTAAAGQAVAELRPVKLPKKLKTGWFVPPMVLSVLPVVSCVLDDWGEAWNVLLAVTAGCNLLITAMSLVFYGLIFRQRKDILDEDLELTEALTRVRRYNWTKSWLLVSWTTAFYSLAVWFCQGNETWYFVWTGVYCVVLVAVGLLTEFATRRAQQRLTQDRTQQPMVDEDDLWIWGQFYYNPNSNRIMINERVGMGMSMNYAHPFGKAMAVLCIAVLLALPLLGVWLMAEELTPVQVTLTEQTLTVQQAWSKFEVELDEIRQVQVLEALPASARIWGTGMPNLLKGTFSVDGYGTCTLCLNPEKPPFLLIETADETYILGLDQAEAVAARLK